MHSSKRFWRGLFFLLLITALCGGLALPVMNAPARAAPQMQAATDLVISEVRLIGSGGSTDEFIEIFNPTAASVDLNGWEIWGANDSGNSNNRYTFSTSILLPSGGHYLLSHTGYDDSVAADAVYLAAIPDNGGVALIRPNGSIADQVGLSVNTLFQETTPLTPLTTNVDRSYERQLHTSGVCTDSNDNSADFFLRNPSDPQNSSSPVTTCGSLTPTSTSTATLTSTPTSTGTTGVPPIATATNTPTATVTSTPPTGSATSIVISEFRTAGNDEFIEIYNPTGNWFDISNWKIYGSNNAGSEQLRATIPVGTILRPGQYYLLATKNTFTITGTSTITANLVYSPAINDDGGIAILNSNGDIVDQVGMSEGSFYQEGTPLSPLTNASRSYEREIGDPLGSCEDTNDNADDFENISPPTPHNSSTRRLCNGAAGPSLLSTTTLITGDTPDPSTINGNVVVSVRVTGNSLSPFNTKVYITGANTNCSITLNSSGTGSCLVKFTTNGIKTITATYLGDNTHQGSSDTETHTVGTASTIRTPTRVPTAVPPPPLIVINEFVPRPGHDWNNDGVINTDDEYIELLNHGVVDVNLSGYTLDDEVNIGSAPFRLPSVTLRPGERRVFYGSETGLLLSDGGDGVRLLKPNGQLGDAYNYRVVRFPDQSYCRLPDNGGADDWNQNCFPTPGLQNSLSGSTVNPPTSGDAENLCPIADTLPADFVFAECPPFGNNIWNPAYWDRNGWYGERNLPNSQGKWNVFVD